MVDDGYAELVARPGVGLGVQPLAREEQVAQARQVVVREQISVRVLALDRAKSRRGGEERLHAVLGDHTPIGAGVGSPDRLAFVEQRRAARE